MPLKLINEILTGLVIIYKEPYRRNFDLTFCNGVLYYYNNLLTSTTVVCSSNELVLSRSIQIKSKIYILLHIGVSFIIEIETGDKLTDLDGVNTRNNLDSNRDI